MPCILFHSIMAIIIKCMPVCISAWNEFYQKKKVQLLEFHFWSTIDNWSYWSTETKKKQNKTKQSDNSFCWAVVDDEDYNRSRVSRSWYFCFTQYEHTLLESNEILSIHYIAYIAYIQTNNQSVSVSTVAKWLNYLLFSVKMKIYMHNHNISISVFDDSI